MIAITQIGQKLTLNDFLALPETQPAREYFSGEIIFAVDEGIKLGWLIDPQDESVMIFQPKQGVISTMKQTIIFEISQEEDGGFVADRGYLAYSRY